MPSPEYSTLYNDPIYGPYVNPNYGKSVSAVDNTNNGNTPWKDYIPFVRGEQKTRRNPFSFFSRWRESRHAKNESNTPITEQDKANKQYNRNVLLNTLGSTLKNAPLVDSILGYFQKKRDTPDYSDIENAKNYALRPTNVYRYSPTHITSNMKFNPYDYSEQANKIYAQSAAAQNLAGRSAAGNTNMLMAHVNNLLSNTNRAAGDAYMNAWKANEQQRMAVAQENRRADEYNANADNNAESAYTQARNQAAIQDKTNGYNALNNYAAQKYARNAAYQQQLDTKRDEMVSNLGTYGQNAYDANQANTDHSYNYWKDPYGRLHFISGINGARPVNNVPATVAFDNDLWKQAYDTFTDEEKEQVGKMNDAERRNFIVDKIRNKTKTA